MKYQRPLPSFQIANVPDRPGSIAVSPERFEWQTKVQDPLRKMGFYFGLAFVFLRFSMLHETLARLTGFSSYLVLLAGAPAVLLAVMSGAVPRSWSNPTCKFWAGFLICFAAAVPFSSWVSQSLTTFSTYLRADFMMLFVLGGMVLTWKECSYVFWAMALSAGGTLGMEKLFADMGNGRLDLVQGTIGNANDYAAHLLLLLPFLLWVILTPSAKVLKALALVLIAFGMYVDLKTGSRGGLIGMAVGVLFTLLRGPIRLRAVIALAVPILIFTMLSLLPASVLVRYSDIFSSPSGDSQKALDTTGAGESMQARKRLLMTSLQLTLEHPLLGVGPGTFSSVEGKARIAQGKLGQWQETHNSYTQISSEIGIPSAFCYLAAIVYTFVTLSRIVSTARRNKIAVMASAAFCCQLSLVMICTAMTFLSLGYRFYLPALSGIAIALQRVLQMEFLPQLQPAPVVTGNVAGFWGPASLDRDGTSPWTATGYANNHPARR